MDALSLHPGGLAPRILDLVEGRAHVLETFFAADEHTARVMIDLAAARAERAAAA